MAWLQLMDGADSIGGTKILLDTGRARLLLDFGLNYRLYGAYFEEHLRPRPARGLVDLWRLGLIPRAADLYRDDLWPADLSPSGPALEVDEVLVSHAHLDHCGLLGLVDPAIPVVAAPAAWAVMKSVQDTGGTDFFSELAYVTPREPQADPRALAAGRWQSTPYQGRAARLAGGELTSDLAAFLSSPPNPRGRPLRPGLAAPHPGTCGGLQVLAFPVDHSLPGALAYAVETDAGWVVYTGDLRLHGHHREDTVAFVEAARRLRPAVLIIEGTRAGPTGGKETSEQDVYRSASRIVRDSRGKLVVADFSPRQVERLATFLRIARESGRTLAVLTKDLYLLEALATCRPDGGLVDDPHLAAFNDISINPRFWDQDLRRRHAGRLVDPREVGEDPGRFILAFSFWDLKHLLDVGETDVVYIYSSSEAHGEEQAIDLRRLWHWLQFLGAEVHGFALTQQGELEFTGELHASGHAAPQELLWVARQIRPDRLIPVHTERPRFFADHLAQEGPAVQVIGNGERVEF
ncbi:MAG: MBL fold metallo-hydrolase RNA specificity domain-containing protein [Candidatus Bipolaricaulaceae bacterium]